MKSIKAIHTLSQIKGYDTIIWDIGNQKENIILGGKEYCKHDNMGDRNRCDECGAYKGKVVDMPIEEYTQKILAELIASPATNTFIISHRDIQNEPIFKSPTNIKTPDIQKYIWLSKYGNFYDSTSQKQTFIFHLSKDGTSISQSRFIVNKTGFDGRLLNLGRTLVINPRPRWIVESDIVDYASDREL